MGRMAGQQRPLLGPGTKFAFNTSSTKPCGGFARDTDLRNETGDGPRSWTRLKGEAMVCRSIPALIAVTLWLTPISAGAKVPELTGAEYLSRCTSKDRNWKPRNQDEQDDAVYCLGYIEGAVTLIILWDGQAY